MKRFLLAVILLLLFVSVSSALTLDQLIGKLQSNQNKIKDMQANVVTKMTSSMPGAKDMVQKGRIWTKGKNKTKMEITSPMKQITINNGQKMAMINPATGQKHIQDLSKVPNAQANQGKQMDFAEAKKKFDFSLKKVSGGYLITGRPKEKNQFMGRMEVLVDSKINLATKVKMFNPAGKVLSTTTIAYKKVSGIYIPYKNVSKVTMPQGKMTVEMTYSNIKVNQGIPDSVFKI